MAVSVSLGAALTTMMLVPHASTAKEMATLAADNDSRGLVLLGITSGRKQSSSCFSKVTILIILSLFFKIEDFEVSNKVCFS